MQAKLLRAAYSDRQLEEVMVDFWFNHFNVFSGKGQVRVYLNEYERDAIRPHVLGTFRELLAGDGRESGDALLSRQLAELGSGGSPHCRAAHGRRANVSTQSEPDAATDRWCNPSAHTGRSASRPAEPSRGAERKLCARADGAAHARRRGGLHAERCAGSRARLYRLDDRQPADRAARSDSSRGCTTMARRSCWAT